jgi:hypothetical protein
MVTPSLHSLQSRLHGLRERLQTRNIDKSETIPHSFVIRRGSHWRTAQWQGHTATQPRTRGRDWRIGDSGLSVTRLSSCSCSCPQTRLLLCEKEEGGCAVIRANTNTKPDHNGVAHVKGSKVREGWISFAVEFEFEFKVEFEFEVD